MTYGMYANIDMEQKHVSRTQDFFSTQRLPAVHIYEIKFFQRWIFASNPKALYIIGDDSTDGQIIVLSQTIWHDKDLADIARRLKEMNPRIVLDAEAEKLIEAYPSVVGVA